MVDKVLARGERDVLVISHHPLVMETSDRGFLPLSETSLVGMLKQGYRHDQLSSTDRHPYARPTV